MSPKPPYNITFTSPPPKLGKSSVLDEVEPPLCMLLGSPPRGGKSRLVYSNFMHLLSELVVDEDSAARLQKPASSTWTGDDDE